MAKRKHVRLKKRRGPMPVLVRPFRIWDENKKQPLPWKFYKTLESAIEHAVVALIWLEVGNEYTIYDDRNGYPHRTYAKRLENHQVKIVEME